jgi:hypothetical protein
MLRVHRGNVPRLRQGRVAVFELPGAARQRHRRSRVGRVRLLRRTRGREVHRTRGRGCRSAQRKSLTVSLLTDPLNAGASVP